MFGGRLRGEAEEPVCRVCEAEIYLLMSSGSLESSESLGSRESSVMWLRRLRDLIGSGGVMMSASRAKVVKLTAVLALGFTFGVIGSVRSSVTSASAMLAG